MRSRPTPSGVESGLRILLLEDQVADAELCERALREAGFRFSLRRVGTSAAFEAELERFDPDLILSDFTLPGDFDGLHALEIAQSRRPSTPFMFVSGTIGEERAVEAVRRGAADYVLKDRMARLGPAVRQALERVRLQKERELAETARKVSEMRLRLFVEHAPAAIAMLDREMRYLAVSRRWLTDYRLGDQDIVGRSHYDVFPEIPEEWKVMHRRCLAGAVEKAEEDSLHRPDGSLDWIKWEIRPWRGDDGEVGGLLLFSEVITERKLQQDRIERLTRIRVLSNEVSTAVVHARDRQQLLDEVCRIAIENGKFGIAWIGMVDWRTLTLAPLAWAGPDTAEYLHRSTMSLREDQPEGRGFIARAVRTGVPAFDNDITQNPGIGGARRAEAIRLGYRSFIVLPLIVEGNVVGVLSLIAKEPSFFQEEKVELLVELSGNISVALESILRLEKLDRLSRIRTVTSEINTAIVRSGDRQTLFREACRIAVDHGGFGIAWIGELDAKTLDITPVAYAGLEAGDFLGTVRSSARSDHPLGQGVIGRALRERRPVVSNDMASETGPAGSRREAAIQRGYQSRIALPLLTEGKVVGGLVLYAREKDFFTEEELRLLTELADNLSFALDHLARQEKIEKLSRIRTISSEVNAAIVRSRNKQQLFYEACRIAVEHGRFGIAWIGELDAEKLAVMPVASAGLEDSTFLMRTTLSVREDSPHGHGTLPRAVRERRPVYNNDIMVNPDVGGERRKEAIRRGYRSGIVLPLIVDGAVAGTFSMFAKELDYFDDEEVKLLTEIAGNISFSLEHLARQQKLDKLSRIRAVSSEINAAIVRIREPQALLEEVCRIASGQGNFELVWIATIDHGKQQVQPVAWTGFPEEIAHAVSWASINAAQGPLGEAIRIRKVTVRNDIAAEMRAGNLRQEALKRGCPSTVCLPLVVDDTVVALVSLYASGRGFFDKDELALLEEVASNVSFSLESIARQEKFDRLSRIRAVLGEINGAIVRIHDRQELFEAACRIVVEVGKLTFAWIGVIEGDPRHVRPAAWAGTPDRILSNPGTRRPLEEREPGGPGLFAEAVTGKRPAIVNDVENDPRVSRKTDHRARGINSIAALPLLVAGKPIGLLGLQAHEIGFFDEEEVKLLSELAGDIALALQAIEKQEQLDYLSFYDALTGLPNRTLFIDRAGQQMRSRGGEPLMTALILINLERFRNINETLGRQGGDELLKLVARRLEAAFHGKDYLARVGADGFGVVMRGIRDTAAVVHGVESQVLDCFREPFRLSGTELRVAAKAGIAMHPADGPDADTLFKNAEAALKKARDSGERYLFYAADMNARAAHVLSLETRLRKAVEARQFVLHYQPKIELASGRVCGLEALIRWQEPGAGLVPPGTFIPLLEETGLILEVGKWALGRALADHREWTARGYRVPRIAVNVSAIQLQRKDFADMVINVVQEEGDNPDALELEVTESLLMKDVEASIRKLAILRGLGIHIAMDDFGTGYSSLSYIARLPISSIKIDRSFTIGMAGNPQDMAIVTTVIALAHSLNLRVVAEGVEAEDQSKLLKLLKCDEAQGYYFGKPLPLEQIEPLLAPPGGLIAKRPFQNG